MFDFSDVIYKTSKNELKMMWLSKNIKLLDSLQCVDHSSKTINNYGHKSLNHNCIFCATINKN